MVAGSEWKGNTHLARKQRELGRRRQWLERFQGQGSLLPDLALQAVSRLQRPESTPRKGLVQSPRKGSLESCGTIERAVQRAYSVHIPSISVRPDRSTSLVGETSTGVHRSHKVE